MLKPSRNKPLLLALAIRICIVSAVAFMALLGLAYVQLNQALDSVRIKEIEDYSDHFAGHVKYNQKTGEVYLDLHPDMRRRYIESGDGNQYLVRDETGLILENSPSVFADRFPPVSTVRISPTFEFEGPDGQKFIGITKTLQLDDKKLFVQIASAEEILDKAYDDIGDFFIIRLLGLGFPLYFVLLTATVITLYRGFLPLQTLTSAVEKMDVQALISSVDGGQVPGEVVPLVRAINFAFARLEKSAQDRQEFTENLAHELRTPLAVLKTRIELLERTAATEKLLHDVDGLIHLANQILDISRIEYEDSLDAGQVDLAAVVIQAGQDFWPLFHKAGRELSVQGAGESVFITGNGDMIYRAICNLLDNALKYAPAGSPVEVILKDKVLEVIDHGETISENKRKIIFDKFRKSEIGLSQPVGVGLGLAIVRKVMDLHGGSIEVLPGEGGHGNIFRMQFC